MKQETTNTFSEGLNYDLNPITTPNNVLTDCINGTFVTFNGDELVLQNDAGNALIPYNVGFVQLSPDFYPLGVKEYGGILYIISSKKGGLKDPLDPELGYKYEIEFGSYPSPVDLSSTSKNTTASFTTLNKEEILSEEIFRSGS
jgi:hypothetical protein